LPSSLRTRRALVAALLVVSTSALLAPAGADESVRDTRKAREEARAAQARAAAKIDVLTAEDAALASGIADIEDAVVGQRAAVDDATAALAAVEQLARDRQAEVTEIEQALAETRVQLTALAVERYTGQRLDEAAAVVFDSRDIVDATRRAALLDIVHGSERDVLARLRDLEAERADAFAAAEAAVHEAEARRTELDAALVELEARLVTQQRLRDELVRRIASWEQEQDELAAEEEELTALLKQRQLAALGVAATEPTAASMRGFVRPTPGAIGSRFGPRLHPIYGVVRMHSGLDMDGKTGDPVFASKEGEVLFAGVRGGYGNAIVIEHDGSVTTVYAHLSKIGVTAGDHVATGEAIGLVGSTGLSTGPHLHFEVRVGGVAKDPELFLP
jgi:murein DD-endopeptidase MepM/ murein hydrolase activator NlpD